MLFQYDIIFYMRTNLLDYHVDNVVLKKIDRVCVRLFKEKKKKKNYHCVKLAIFDKRKANIA